ATFYYISRSNYEFLVYIGAIVAVGLLVLGSLKKTHIDLVALWGLSIWGLLHMLGGSLKIAGGTLYSYRIIDIIDKGGQFYILKMDQVIHFYGFLVAAIVVCQILNAHLPAKKHPFLLVFVAWIGSMGLGAL